MDFFRGVPSWRFIIIKYVNREEHNYIELSCDWFWIQKGIVKDSPVHVQPNSSTRMHTVRGWLLCGTNRTHRAIMGGLSSRSSGMYVLTLPRSTCLTTRMKHATYQRITISCSTVLQWEVVEYETDRSFWPSFIDRFGLFVFQIWPVALRVEPIAITIKREFLNDDVFFP